VKRRTGAAWGAGSIGVAATAARLLLGSAALVSLGLFIDTAQVQNGAFTTDSLDPATGLSATGGATIGLSWTATADTYASGHRIFRSTTAGGPYSLIAEVTPRTARWKTMSRMGVERRGFVNKSADGGSIGLGGVPRRAFGEADASSGAHLRRVRYPTRG